MPTVTVPVTSIEANSDGILVATLSESGRENA